MKNASRIWQSLTRRLKQVNTRSRRSRSRRINSEPLESRVLLSAASLEVTVENLSPADGLFQTPFWVGVHEGSFDVGTVGSPASQFPGLELLAEEGGTGELSASFGTNTNGVDATITSPGGFAGAPVFDPGEFAGTILDIADSRMNRYFSFASMIIPSNDAFVGNLNPQAYELFDAAGNFRGPLTIDLLGSDVWDAGTETNNAQGGAAFSTEGGTSADENGTIQPHTGLNDFVGTGLPTGGSLGTAFSTQTPIARITVDMASGPQAALQAQDLNTAGAEVHEFQVVYSDPSGVDVDSINRSNVRVIRIGNDGSKTSLNPTSVTTDASPGTNPQAVTATFRLEAPDGTFDAADSGRYFVVQKSQRVRDSLGNGAAFRNLGRFDVNISPVQATLDIMIENLSPAGGLFQTPFWVGVHDGNFDVASIGRPASDFPGLELLAEEGGTGELSTFFGQTSNGVDATITSPGGFAGAPVFDPGEVVNHRIEVNNPADYRYFSFASMLIPSNDAFLANLNPTAYELFDASGDFNGPVTIDLFGSDVWDAGTEINDAQGGAAFSTEGGTPVDEGGTIQPHTGLDDFIGTGLPTGNDLLSAFNGQTPVARITITQPPLDDQGPDAQLQADDLNEGGEATLSFDVVYSDPSGIDVASIDRSDVRVVRIGNNGRKRSLDPVAVSTDAAPGTTPNIVTATYQLAAPDGTFGADDSGRYFVIQKGRRVEDTLGNTRPFENLGRFDVSIVPQTATLSVSIENLSSAGGLFQTPFWVGVHDGGFDVASVGSPASDFTGLERLAEEGGTGELSTFFGQSSSGVDTTIVSPGGFPGAPVFDPGELVTQLLQVSSPASNRYFSFASMIIPSNDAFLANLNPMAYELFDATGNFNGPVTIDLFGNDIWDAGTEVNDAQGGAAFSTAGGASADENGTIQPHTGLDDFIGTGLPTGNDLLSAFDGQTAIARITITQPPVDDQGPEARLQANDLRTNGAATHEFNVVYSDPSGVDVSSINRSNVRVIHIGNDGSKTSLNPISVSTDAAPGANPETVVATYRLSASGGAFGPEDAGQYYVIQKAGRVRDLLNNATPFQNHGRFNVNIAPPTSLEITIENRSAVGGLFQTPYWVGVHDGAFDIASLGQPASETPGLELLAEEGGTGELSAFFAQTSDGVDATITSPGGFPGAPVFDPGEIATQPIVVDNPAADRYFSFASMIIPSNDAFLANLNPTAYELFDSQGNFNGTLTIDLIGSDVWDAGTEINNAQGGAAFSTEGGASVDQNGTVQAHPGLNEFIGTGLPTGGDLQVGFNAQTEIARITIRQI